MPPSQRPPAPPGKPHSPIARYSSCSTGKRQLRAQKLQVAPPPREARAPVRRIAAQHSHRALPAPPCPCPPPHVRPPRPGVRAAALLTPAPPPRRCTCSLVPVAHSLLAPRRRHAAARPPRPRRRPSSGSCGVSSRRRPMRIVRERRRCAVPPRRPTDPRAPPHPSRRAAVRATPVLGPRADEPAA